MNVHMQGTLLDNEETIVYYFAHLTLLLMVSK